ncbi:MAG TPA: zf-HC2 domain-containing protein [Pyrinomonadaceae bacterium]|jgi:hypothetical protein
MREVDETEALLRRFLLDELGEEERERVEQLFLADSDYREKVLIAEDDLIDDYLDGALSPADSARFRSHYLSTPRQRRKLRVAKSIKKYSAARLAAPPAGGTPQSGAGGRGRAAHVSLRNPLVSLPLAAALVLAFGLGAVKLIESWRFNRRQAQEQSRREADERELARLNDSSLPASGRAGSAAFLVTVLPVSTRGVAAAQFAPPRDATPVQLLLVLPVDEYQSYQAELQRLGTSEWRTVRRLRAENTPAGKAISLIVPARLLPRGDYRLRLSGETPAGAPEEIGEYTFQVTGR